MQCGQVPFQWFNPVCWREREVKVKVGGRVGVGDKPLHRQGYALLEWRLWRAPLRTSNGDVGRVRLNESVHPIEA